MSVPRRRDRRPLATVDLERMSAEFEREFVADTFGPAPPEVRARLRRARVKRGRPRSGAGSQAISVTIEKGLLRAIDALARKKRVPRAQLIAAGLRVVLASHGGKRTQLRASELRNSGARKGSGVE